MVRNHELTSEKAGIIFQNFGKFDLHFWGHTVFRFIQQIQCVIGKYYKNRAQNGSASLSIKDQHNYLCFVLVFYDIDESSFPFLKKVFNESGKALKENTYPVNDSLEEVFLYFFPTYIAYAVFAFALLQSVLMACCRN